MKNKKLLSEQSSLVIFRKGCGFRKESARQELFVRPAKSSEMNMLLVLLATIASLLSNPKVQSNPALLVEVQGMSQTANALVEEYTAVNVPQNALGSVTPDSDRSTGMTGQNLILGTVEPSSNAIPSSVAICYISLPGPNQLSTPCALVRYDLPPATTDQEMINEVNQELPSLQTQLSSVSEDIYSLQQQTSENTTPCNTLASSSNLTDESMGQEGINSLQQAQNCASLQQELQGDMSEQATLQKDISSLQGILIQ